MADSAPVFYAPEVEDGPAVLSTEESHHAVKVLRLREGAGVTVFNGRGLILQGHIVHADSKAVEVSASHTHRAEPRPNRLHVAISPPKSADRLEWFLEKACELGIEEISIVWSENSERKRVNEDRLKKVVISAIKQSRNPYMPKLNEPIRLSEFLAAKMEGNKLIAHCGNAINTRFADALEASTNTTILIGPEGDFSEKEIELALENGFKEVTFGSQRLRTETAGIMACAVFHEANYR